MNDNPTTEAQEELRRSALAAFHPMVLHFSSSTPGNVNLDAVLEACTRDAALKDRFYTVDLHAAVAAASTTQGTTGAGGSGGTRSAKGADKEKSRHVTSTAGDSGTDGRHPAMAQLVWQEFERIAVERETARRAVALARVRRLEEATAQYVEDGLPDAEARAAAEEDLRAEEDDFSEEEDEEEAGAEPVGAGSTESDGMTLRGDNGGSLARRLPVPSFPASMAVSGEKGRDPIFFCLHGSSFPSSLEDVKGLYAAGVPLHVVFNVTSKVPLLGSADRARVESGEKPRNRVDGRGRPPSVSTVGKRANGAVANAGGSGGKGHAEEEGLSSSLPERILDHQGSCHCGGSATCCAVGEVLVHSIEFPSEALPSSPAATAPEYRLTVPERVVLNSIKDTILEVEKQWHLFCTLTQGRDVVTVPSYTALPDPTVRAATALAPLAADDREGGSRPNSRTGSLKRRSTTPPRRLSPGIAARLDSTVAASGALLDGAAHGAGEPPQSLTPATPSTMSEVAARTAEYEQARDRQGADGHNARSFLAACIAQTEATLKLRAPAATVSSDGAMPASEAPATFCAEEAAAQTGILPPEAPPSLLLSAEARSQWAMQAEQAAVAEYAARVLASTFGGGEQRSGATVSNVAVGHTLTPTLQRAGGLSGEVFDVRRAVEQATHATFPHLSPAAVSQQTSAALQRAIVVDAPAAEVHLGRLFPLRDALATKNRLGWRSTPIKGDALRSDAVLYSRGDGKTRCEGSVYAFDAVSSFPSFVRHLAYCAAEHAHYYPPPLPSDEDDDPTPTPSSSEESDTESEEASRSSSLGSDGGTTQGAGTDHRAEALVEDESTPAQRKRHRRRKAETPPPPPPLVDHFRKMQELLRRRRVFEETKKYYARVARDKSEVVVRGAGAHGAAEEVEWAFPADGTTIEVARSNANRNQLISTITAPNVPSAQGYEMGYLIDENAEVTKASRQLEGVPSRVASSVRGFLRVGSAVQLVTEVVADNTLAAETAAYAKAVAEARASAKVQFEALQGNAKGKGGRSGGASTARDKNAAAAQPTLAEMEDAAEAAVPPVQQRPKEAPLLRLSLMFDAQRIGGGCPSYGHLDQGRGALTVVYLSNSNKASNACAVDMQVSIWCLGSGPLPGDDSGHEEVVRIFSIAKAAFLVDGHVELFAQKASRRLEDYRVILGPRGTCITVHGPSASALVTGPNGAKSLYQIVRPDASGLQSSPSSDVPAEWHLVKQLPSVKSAMERAAGSTFHSVLRADGVSLHYYANEKGSQQHRDGPSATKVTFGRGVDVTWSPPCAEATQKEGPQNEAARTTTAASFTWSLGSRAPFRIQCHPGRGWLTVLPPATGSNCSAITYQHHDKSLVISDTPPHTVQGAAVGADEKSSSDCFRLRALVDLKRYRLEWHTRTAGPSPVTGWYAVDCAFGGIYAEVRTDHKSITNGGPLQDGTDVVRISPWGRLSLQRQGAALKQVFPTTYGALVADAAVLSQPLLLAPEVVSQRFVDVLAGSGVEFDAEHAVHLCEAPQTRFPHLGAMTVAWPSSSGDPSTADVNFPGTVAAMHRLSKAQQALRALLQGTQENPPSEDDTIGPNHHHHKALLACEWLLTSTGNASSGGNATATAALFLDDGLASSVADTWCRMVEAQMTNRLPTVTTSLMSGLVDQPARVALHDDLIGEYRVSPFIRVFCAAGGETTASGVKDMSQWWGEHLPATVRRQSEHRVSSPTAAPTLASATSVSTTQQTPKPPLHRVKVDKGVSSALRTDVTTSRAGRLCYWQTALCPSPDILHQERPVPARAEAAESVAAAPLDKGPLEAASADEESVAQPKADRAASRNDPANGTIRGGPPLMLSKRAVTTTDSWDRTVTLHASTHSSVPRLALAPVPAADGRGDAPSLLALDFGDIMAGRRYSIQFTVTNTSTVPCRYRVTAPRELRKFLSVAYPHRFLAAGMADTVTVTLSGHQPFNDGGTVGHLCVSYEGATVEVGVRWRTAHAVPDFATTASVRVKGAAGRLAPGVVCLGEALTAFQPGTTRRFNRGSDDDDALIGASQRSGRRGLEDDNGSGSSSSRTASGSEEDEADVAPSKRRQLTV